MSDINNFMNSCFKFAYRKFPMVNQRVCDIKIPVLGEKNIKEQIESPDAKIGVVTELIFSHFDKQKGVDECFFRVKYPDGSEVLKTNYRTEPLDEPRNMYMPKWKEGAPMHYLCTNAKDYI
jgi:hypothetical protein